MPPPLTAEVLFETVLPKRLSLPALKMPAPGSAPPLVTVTPVSVIATPLVIDTVLPILPPSMIVVSWLWPTSVRFLVSDRFSR